MKRALIAALTGLALQPAWGQFTVFGLLDLNVSSYRAGSRSGTGNMTVMNDGTLNGIPSRFGVRAEEDLGGGWRAMAVLEQGILADTGQLGQGGRAWGRQAFVSLSSTEAGELRLGRQYVLSDLLIARANPFVNGMLHNPNTAIVNRGRNLPLFVNPPRADNVAQWQSPAWQGLVLAAQLAPGEATADRFHGLRLMQNLAKGYWGLSYELSSPRSGNAANKSWTLAGQHEALPGLKLMAALQRNRELTTTAGNGVAGALSNLLVDGPVAFTATGLDGITVGLEQNLTGPWILGLNHTQVRYLGASGQRASYGKLAVSLVYRFSPRTLSYLGLGHSTGDLRSYVAQQQILQAGLRTAF
ncbi:porin [Pelomonas sp. SE-A7]|uniref:porin n=1 Tax=Pelomonas sp. SE-A7 TaxID=3054953 RepID=UPI00259CDCB3|nr:porin [Pelomonas sp. SE-A7]MDM4765056.1 porin [Pelomonas sp. SE-A7]